MSAALISGESQKKKKQLIRIKGHTAISGEPDTLMLLPCAFV